MGRRKIMHRVVVYGLIGLVVNVLVAWGFAAWGQFNHAWVGTDALVTGVMDLRGPVSRWAVAMAGMDNPPETHGESSGLGVRGIIEFDGAALRLDMVECGWPLASLRWHQWSLVSDIPPLAFQRGWWINLPSSWKDTSTPGGFGLQFPRRLPLEPVWTGLLVNSLIYGGVIGVSVLLSGWARRAIRRMRGRCPSCGYDLCGELAGGCPECGWRRNG